jgi:uncharacterized protein (DUF3084 family)
MVRKPLISIFLVLALGSSTAAQPAQFTEQDREMLRGLDKRMAVLEATLKEFKESIEKRFEQIDKRFEQVDKRFEQVDKRMDSIITFIQILAAIFTAMTITTIGFAIWDRRTALRPVEQRLAENTRLTEENRKKVEGLEKEVTRLSAAYDELKAQLTRANLL